MQKYEVREDSYHKKKRLDLYQFDGSPVNAMLLNDENPSMLPTTTLNPMTSATTAPSRIKRGVVPARRHRRRTTVAKEGMGAADRWWWLGVIMTSAGGLMLFYS